MRCHGYFCINPKNCLAAIQTQPQFDNNHNCKVLIFTCGPGRTVYLKGLFEVRHLVKYSIDGMARIYSLYC